MSLFKPSIKLLVQYPVKFTHYFDKQLWYEIVYNEPNAIVHQNLSFSFPVPIDDIGNATFLAEDKGILFMRYIRKQMNLLYND